MAGGPLKSGVVIENSDRVWGGIYIGGGSNAHRQEAVTVEASLSADTITRYRFEVPPVLPSGTAKLRLLLMASAEAGIAKIDPSWASVAIGEDASVATLQSEGVQSVTWAGGDIDVFKEAKITLDAPPEVVTAKEFIVMRLTFVNSGWTLAAQMACIPSIIWE